MTILGEINDLMNSDEARKIAGVITNRASDASLARKARTGVLQFPVVTSRALDLDTAQMINKALERNFASFALLAISMNSKMGEHQTVAGKLAEFHTHDIQPSTSKVNVLRALGDVQGVAESYSLDDYETYEDFRDDITVCGGYLEEIAREHADQSFCAEDHLVMESVNDIVKPVNRYQRYLMNSGRYDQATEAVGNKDSKVSEIRELPKDIFRDNDGRKANELIPTMIQIRLSSQQGEGVVYHDIVLGVKAYMHPVTSEEMTSNMINALRRRDVVFQFLRWTSGEISFFRDFLTGASYIKEDLINSSQRGHSKVWSEFKSLSRQSNMGKTLPPLAVLNRGILKGLKTSKVRSSGGLIPNSTIVMTQEEVNHIKYTQGFDLNDVATMTSVMQTYFMQGIVIVDVPLQQASFYFDGDRIPQVLSFSALEKENSNRSDIKELMKALNRS